MNKNSIQNDFRLFSKDRGISSLSLHYEQKRLENSLTPYILEERKLNVSQMDIFSRLLHDRIIWVAGVIDDHMSPVTQAQLMFLDNLSEEPITMHLDTPGGSVKAGLSIVDTMDYIKSDIMTINTGMAASMGSVLLGAGTKGMRYSLRFSKTMLHRSSGGVGGNIADAEIGMNEWQKTDKILFDLLGGYCGKDPKQVKKDAKRDFWMTADEAKKYGIIDDIIIKKI